MAKVLCKVKNVTKDLEKYAEKVKNPKYVCKKCGRVAKKSKSLCSPVDLP